MNGMETDTQTSKANTVMLVDFIIKLIYDGIIIDSLNYFICNLTKSRINTLENESDRGFNWLFGIEK